jgi:autotransporter-associated beta strand protein
MAEVEWLLPPLRGIVGRTASALKSVNFLDIQDMKTSKFAAFAVSLILSIAGAPVRAQWNQNADVGPYDYTDPANWAGGIVNNQFTNNPISGLNLTFSTDFILTNGVLMNFAGPSNITFRSDSATPRTLHISLGQFVKTNTGGGTITVGTNGFPLILDLFGSTRTLGGTAGNATGNATMNIYAQIIDSAPPASHTNGVKLSGNRVFTYLLCDSNSFTGPVSFYALRGGGFSSIKNIGAGPSAMGAPTDTTNGTVTAIDNTSQGSVTYLGTGDTTDRPFVWNITGSTYAFQNQGSGKITFTGPWTFPAQVNRTNQFTVNALTSGIELAGSISNLNSGFTNIIFTGGLNTNRIVLSGLSNEFPQVTVTNVVLAFNNVAVGGQQCALGTNGTIFLDGNGATSAISNPTGDGATLQYFGPSTIFPRSIAIGGLGYNWAIDNAGTNTTLTLPNDLVSISGGGGTIQRFIHLNVNSAAAQPATTEVQGAIPEVVPTASTTVVIGNSAGYVLNNGGVVRLLNPTNSFSGGVQVKYARTLQVMTLADSGQPSSIGTGGGFPAAGMTMINIGSTDSQRGGTFAYIGTNDASCNRGISILGLGAASSGTILNNSPNNSRLHFTDTGSMAFNAVIAHAAVILGGTAQATNILDEVIPNVPTNTTSVLVNGSVWQLTAANTYSDTTTVSNGTLLIEGSIGPGADVTVGKNGVLGGNGVINNNVTVLTNGTLSPGGSIGLLTINGNLTNHGTILMELNKAAGTNDHIVGANNLQYGGTLMVTNLAGSLTVTDSFPLFSATTYSGAFTSISPATPGPGLAWDLSGLTNGTLRITVGASAPPTITTITVGGGNVILSGTNGTAGQNYYVLTSTNVALPLTNWTRAATSMFDSLGNFSYTNAVSPAIRQEYFRIQLP